ncbi:MAG TPA: lipopolysaccharide heptosyltransferase II, partial [Candidatus Binataceae bacterium]
LPTLAALRKAFPAARLSVLVDHGLAAFFDGAGWIDEIIPLRRSKRFAPLELARVVGQLRARRFDLAVVLPNSFVSALRVTLAGIPSRAGLIRDRRGWMLTNRAPPDGAMMNGHQMHYWLGMLKATLDVDADLAPIAPEVAPLHLDRMRQWLAARRNACPKLVAIAPAAAYGPAKEWPPSYYAALISSLAERGVQSVLVGGAGDAAGCEAIAAAAACGAIIAAGQTNIGELMALLSLCDGFAGNDSGAAHLASSLGVPTVAIFGSTAPQRTGPLGPRTTILYKGLPCSPCLARTCRFGHYRCLRDITPNEALAALENLGALG